MELSGLIRTPLVVDNQPLCASPGEVHLLRYSSGLARVVARESNFPPNRLTVGEFYYAHSNGLFIGVVAHALRKR